MATTTFDLGPLSWVKTEIDYSLNEAREQLDLFVANPKDAAPLKFAETHLHQATGALAMVEVVAAARFGEEIEKLVLAVERLPQAEHRDAVATAKRGIAALARYLDALMAGEPDEPLRLASTFIALNRARGATDAAEIDLFHPNLDVRPPLETAPALVGDVTPDLVRRRGQYQAALVHVIRGQQVGENLRVMQAAVAGVDRLYAHSPNRLFWWCCVGFFDALIGAGTAPDAPTKQLVGKIDIQLKRLIEGSHKIGERLFRDVLFAIGHAPRRSRRIDEVRAHFNLDSLLRVGDFQIDQDVEQARAAVKEMRDALHPQKENWLKYAAGSRGALDEFARQANEVSRLARLQANGDVRLLADGLAEIPAQLKAKNLPVSDAVALETAATMLLLEAGLEQPAALGRSFERQTRSMLARVKAAIAGQPLPALDQDEGGLLDDIAKRAQERLLMFQVGHEILADLAGIEQGLDAFFRDVSRRGELKQLARSFQRVQGALTMLQFDDAASLNKAVSELTARVASESHAMDSDDAERIADGLSALGLYISAQQRGDVRAADVLEPALVRLGLKAPPAFGVEAEPQAPAVPIIDDAIEAAQSRLRDPRDTSALAPLEIEREKTAEPTAVAAPSADTVRMAASPTSQIDAELLEIFLEEATEVLGTVGQHLDELKRDSGNKNALTTVRRGFHTLKGSGRMVGLTDLGEVAWQVEQVLNKWMQEERNVTPGVMRLIDETHRSFNGWIAALKAQEHVVVDGTATHALAETLKAGQEPAPPSATVIHVAPAAPPAVEPVVEPVAIAPVMPEILVPPAHIEPEVPAEVSIVPVPEPVMETAPLAEEALAQATDQDEVKIGDVGVPPFLLSIYLSEAEQHVTELDAQTTRMAESPGAQIDNGFMRAAHTLAGISRTTGIAPVAELAYALERWLQETMAFPAPATPAQLDLNRRTVAALDAMLALVRDKMMPGSRHDLIEEFDRLIEDAQQARRAAGETSFFKLPGWLSTLEDVNRPAVAAETSEAGELPLAPTEIPSEAQAPAEEMPVAARAPVESAPVEPAPAATVLPLRPDVALPVVTAALSPAATVVTAPAREKQLADAAQRLFHDTGVEQRRIQDDLDEQLLPVFLEEAKEIVPQVGDGLRAWRGEPAGKVAAGELKRHLHTLKGSARMAGLMRLGELAHLLETRVELMDKSSKPTPADFDEIEAGIDRFQADLERLERGEFAAPMPELPATVAAEFADRPAPIAAMSAAQQVVVQAAAQGESPQEARERAAMLRVPADMVDRLVNQAGEVSIARTRIEGELLGFKRSLAELSDNVTRLKAQLREIEIQAETQIQSSLTLREEGGSFDPLEFDRFTRLQELTRFLAESVNDVTTVQQSLAKNIDETDAALLAQARISRDLSQQLMGVRMVPFSALSDRLYRVVRLTAKELGKRANLELRGVAAELDRGVLEKITAPFEHLLRNAVDHGLETPEARTAAGKPETGDIYIEASPQGNEIVITVRDDGRGLDMDRIRARAVETGLLAADAESSENELAQFIFVPGFSTAEHVTEVSGRGVGMDVVKNEIASLGGRVEVRSVQGKGTSFTITLPLTLAVTQAVLVRAGHTLYAIPSVMVEQVLELKAQPFADALAARQIEWQGNTYPLQRLRTLLEDHTPDEEEVRLNRVMLTKSAGQRAGVAVEEILGNREIVVKTIGPQLARIVGITGATVLGNGQVVLIINPVPLAARAAALPPAPPVAVVPAATVQERVAPLVMVVDDSLTVRKITSRLLAREGFEVVTAKDGVDGLKQLEEKLPDVILLDIEMPRMDGFEFTRNLRADSRWRAIPIVMITSRTADKHRSHAFELGVNEYLGKPFQEEELLRLIRQHLGEKAAQHA